MLGTHRTQLSPPPKGQLGVHGAARAVPMGAGSRVVSFPVTSAREGVGQYKPTWLSPFLPRQKEEMGAPGMLPACCQPHCLLPPRRGSAL